MKPMDISGKVLYNGSIEKSEGGKRRMKSRNYGKRRTLNEALKKLTLKQKAAGSLICILVYRLLSFVPLPYVDTEYIRTLIGANGSISLLNVMSGGNLGNMSIMALGVGPWITASIVLQLIGMAFPKFADLNKEESGKKTYKLITFGSSVLFALFEGLGIMLSYGRSGYLTDYTWYTVAAPVFLMMLGSGILSLMGWFIDEKLFGNGTSLILTAGILCSYVSDGTVLTTVLGYGKGTVAVICIALACIMAIFYLFLYTVFISMCEKRIPVQYSGKMPASGSMKNVGNIPVKLVTGGVVPVIFASTIITMPALIGTLVGSDAHWLEIFNTSAWLRADHWWASIGFVLYIILIVAFGYFCQVMYMNPAEIAKNLQKNGGTVPGVRPGKPTADYITRQTKWLTGLGGLFLAVVAAVPIIVSGFAGLSGLSFLGTSLLIVVSTIKETIEKWQSENMMNTRTGVKSFL